jgi:hypothetical protein
MSRPVVVWILSCANFAVCVVVLFVIPSTGSLAEAILGIYFALSSMALAIGILRRHHLAYLALLGRVALLVIFGLVKNFPFLALLILAVIAFLLRRELRRQLDVNVTVTPPRVDKADHAFDTFMTEWKNKCMRGRTEFDANK